MRYRILNYKYVRNVQPRSAYHGSWESFGRWSGQSGVVWRPAVDVYETADTLVAVIDLAGVLEEDMSITLFDDLVVVEGRRDQPVLMNMNACHQFGIKYGVFKTEIDLPCEVDYNTVGLEHHNGLLKIVMQKRTPAL